MNIHSFCVFNACTTWFDSKDYTQQKHSAFRNSNARTPIPFWYGRSSVLTFRPRPLSSHLEKVRFSHTREVWSFEHYEHETHHTSHVRSWTRPMRFKLKILAIQAKVKCFWVTDDSALSSHWVRIIRIQWKELILISNSLVTIVDLVKLVKQKDL